MLGQAAVDATHKLAEEAGYGFRRRDASSDFTGNEYDAGQLFSLFHGGTEVKNFAFTKRRQLFQRIFLSVSEDKVCDPLIDRIDQNLLIFMRMGP